MLQHFSSNNVLHAIVVIPSTYQPVKDNYVNAAPLCHMENSRNVSELGGRIFRQNKAGITAHAWMSNTVAAVADSQVAKKSLHSDTWLFLVLPCLQRTLQSLCIYKIFTLCSCFQPNPLSRFFIVVLYSPCIFRGRNTITSISLMRSIFISPSKNIYSRLANNSFAATITSRDTAFQDAYDPK